LEAAQYTELALIFIKSRLVFPHHVEGEIDMTAQPPAPTQKGSARPGSGVPDTREQLVDSIAHLLSGGRSVSDVLEHAKKLAGRFAEPISDAKSEPKSTAIELPAPPFDAGFPNELDTRETQDPLPSEVAEQKTRLLRLGGFTGRFVSWPVLTGVLLMAGVAGAALFANLPMADAVSIVTTLTAKPAVKPAALNPATPPAEPDGTAVPRSPKLSTEQATMLLDRGDELMKRADVSAGRLFYERAAGAGNPEAALRLGASYDPAFLTRIGIKGAHGDPALAAQWYKRARDLGATAEAEILLKALK
jgi:hypothetical protein